MTTVPLLEAGYVTLNGSGNGTARVGPAAPGVVWRLAVASVRTSTAVLSPQCRVYVGSDTSDGNFKDGTYTGQQNGTDLVIGQEVRLGQYVWAVWTGGDVGAQATLTVSGTKDI